MKKILFLLFCLPVLGWSQNANIVDQFETLETLNDSTYQLRTFNVHEYTVVYDSIEYTFRDTVLVPPPTVLDSAGVIRYLFTSQTNIQAREAGRVAQTFATYTTHQGVAAANTLIDQISGSESNYFEESAKFFARATAGRYRVFVDSSGVAINFFANLSLFTPPAHPDGRLMRLTREDTGDFWTVQVYHRNKFRLVNFFGATPFYYWDRISDDRRLYRPDTFATRQTSDRLVKVN